MKHLSHLQPPAGAVRRTKRLGRGESSGHGKTSTRGQKGSGARTGSGGLHPWFEGGQMPLIKRIPKRGFTNPLRVAYQVVNLGDLERVFESKAEVTPASLAQRRLIRAGTAPVKILGSGQLTKPLLVEAHAFSATAKEAIEKAGGQTKTC